MMTFMICNFLMIIATMAMNPMKMGMIMVFTSLSIMLSIYQQSGKSWLPTTMFMLFMGGILVMFMILASTLPNEKTKKTGSNLMSVSMLAMGVYTFSMLILNQTITQAEQMQQMKMVMTNSELMPMLLTVIILYFVMFISELKNYKTSMRTM